MTSKKANWLFLTIVLTHIGTVLFLLFWGNSITLGIVANFFLSEAILMVPALLFLLAFERKRDSGGNVGSSFSAGPMFRRVKLSTLLMTMLCTVLIMPLVTVLNALTMFFAENEVAALQGDILGMPFPVMLFMIGIFGPFCEEFVFRGIMYRSYGKCAGVGAVLLSAFTFGLMHMNFNQALYAFGIGIFLAVLAEAAGSLWASVCCHMFFNSCQVVLMYLSGWFFNSVYGRAVSEAAEDVTKQELLAALSVYLVIASVTTPIAVCVIVWIMKNEGRQKVVKTVLFGRQRRNAYPDAALQAQGTFGQKRQGCLLSVPLVVAVVLCLGYMSLELFLIK